MKAGILLSALLWALIISLTGCNGFQAKITAGVERVDTSQSSQQMYIKPVPWKCYIIPCAEENQIAEGS